MIFPTFPPKPKQPNDPLALENFECHPSWKYLFYVQARMFLANSLPMDSDEYTEEKKKRYVYIYTMKVSLLSLSTDYLLHSQDSNHMYKELDDWALPFLFLLFESSTQTNHLLLCLYVYPFIHDFICTGEHTSFSVIFLRHRLPSFVRHDAD